MVFNEAAVLGQVAVDGMFGLEGQSHLPGSRGFEQFLDVAQAHGAVGHGLVAGCVDRAERVRLGQGDQAHDRAQADRSLGGYHAPGPVPGGRSQGLGAALPIGQLPLDRSMATTQPEATGEPSRFEPRVDGDLLEAQVEDTHFACIPPGPDGLPDVLGWDEVQGAFDLDVAVTMD